MTAWLTTNSWFVALLIVIVGGVVFAAWLCTALDRLAWRRWDRARAARRALLDMTDVH